MAAGAKGWHLAGLVAAEGLGQLGSSLQENIRCISRIKAAGDKHRTTVTGEPQLMGNNGMGHVASQEYFRGLCRLPNCTSA